jgi:hypothetical protein
MLAKVLAWLSGLFRRVSGSGPLCDRCKYDYGTACMRPERPNAYRCPDFKAR